MDHIVLVKAHWANRSGFNNDIIVCLASGRELQILYATPDQDTAGKPWVVGFIDPGERKRTEHLPTGPRFAKLHEALDHVMRAPAP